MLICLYQECAVMMRHCANKLDEHCLVGIVRSDRHNVGLLFRYLEKGYASNFRMPGKSRTRITKSLVLIERHFIHNYEILYCPSELFTKFNSCCHCTGIH